MKSYANFIMVFARLNFQNFIMRNILKIFKKRSRQFGIFRYLYLPLDQAVVAAGQTRQILEKKIVILYCTYYEASVEHGHFN